MASLGSHHFLSCLVTHQLIIASSNPYTHVLLGHLFSLSRWSPMWIFFNHLFFHSIKMSISYQPVLSVMFCCVSFYLMLLFELCFSLDNVQLYRRISISKACNLNHFLFIFCYMYHISIILHIISVILYSSLSVSNTYWHKLV